MSLGKNDPPVNGQCGMTSLCHPWGALPCKYLNEEVLGIKLTTPGFGTVDIFPHLGRKLTRVAGTTPTLKGDISASFDVSAGKCSVSVPAGVTARVGVPKVERTIKSITINGVLAWDGQYHPVTSIGGASEDADFVCFTSVQPGSHDFLVSYEGTTPAAVDPVEVFPVKFVGEDAATQGNWGGVYGADGYVLPNYNGVGKDVRVLPSYVSFRGLGSSALRERGLDDQHHGGSCAGARPEQFRAEVGRGPLYQRSRADLSNDVRGHRGQRNARLYVGPVFPRLGPDDPASRGANDRSADVEATGAGEGGAGLPRGQIPCI